MMLVTLEDAKLDLAIDGNDLDPLIYKKIRQASDLVLKHIKYGTEDSNGDPIHDFSDGVPGDIQSAVMMVLAELVKNREAGSSNPMSQAVIDILAPYRQPTIA